MYFIYSIVYLDLQSMAAFLIEDDRIFSFLDSLDILRLY